MKIVDEILERVDLLFDPNIGLFKFREDMLIDYYDDLKYIFDNLFKLSKYEVERRIERLDNDLELELQQYITDILNVSDYYYIDVEIKRNVSDDEMDIKFILLPGVDKDYYKYIDIDNVEFDDYFVNLRRDRNEFFFNFKLVLNFSKISLCNVFFGYNDKEFKDFLIYLVSALYHEIRHFYQSLKVSIDKNLYGRRTYIVNKILSYKSNDYESYFLAKFEIDSYAYGIAKYLFEHYEYNIDKILRFLKNPDKYEKIRNIEVLYFYREVFGKDSEVYKLLLKKIYKFLYSNMINKSQK